MGTQEYICIRTYMFCGEVIFTEGKVYYGTDDDGIRDDAGFLWNLRTATMRIQEFLASKNLMSRDEYRQLQLAKILE